MLPLTGCRVNRSCTVLTMDVTGWLSATGKAAGKAAGGGRWVAGTSRRELWGR